jgi:uncharacterized Zn finger protein (UPF0148 family)
MAELDCPKCRAAINPDLVGDSGRVECPFCGNNWSLLDTSTLPTEIFTNEPKSGGVPARARGGTQQAAPLPLGSRIKVIEEDQERLVLYIPGGGKQAAALGCFAILWNGFMCIFTPPWFLGAFQGPGNNPPPVIFLILFLGLFWSIGLGLACFWLKMKYERVFLLLDRDRLVVQKVLFNRKRIQETALSRDSRAALVESYQQNDTPVYRIEVQGKSRAAKFGTALSDEEKDWLVDRINDFLDVTPVTVEAASAMGGVLAPGAGATAVVPQSCRKCGAPLIGAVVNGALTCTHCGDVYRIEVLLPGRMLDIDRIERLEPADLPPDSPIRVDEDSDGVLQLSYPATSDTPLRWVLPLILIPFSMAWFGGVFAVFAWAWQAPFLLENVFFVLFSVPFLTAGLVPLGMALAAIRGRTTVRLTGDSLTCRWHVGRFGRSRSLSTAAIDRIRIANFANVGQNPRVKSPTRSQNVGWECCIVHAGSQKMLLTVFLDETVARQVAALVRTRLEKMGHALRDV